MEAVIIVIHLIIVVALIAVVLLQRSEGGALGIGGGGGGFLTSRGTANVLTRATAVLAAAFFATSIILTILARLNAPPSAILDEAETEPAAPSVPSQPGDAGGGSILDQIRGEKSSGTNLPLPSGGATTPSPATAPAKTPGPATTPNPATIPVPAAPSSPSQ